MEGRWSSTSFTYLETKAMVEVVACFSRGHSLDRWLIFKICRCRCYMEGNFKSSAVQHLWLLRSSHKCSWALASSHKHGAMGTHHYSLLQNFFFIDGKLDMFLTLPSRNLLYTLHTHQTVNCQFNVKNFSLVLIGRMSTNEDREMYGIPVNTPWWMPTNLEVDNPWYGKMLPQLKEKLLPTLWF